jgi:primosomal protein N' (replication factor Y)
MFDRFCDVAVGLPLDELLTYRARPDTEPGMLVTVLVRGRHEKGIVVRVHGQEPSMKALELLDQGLQVLSSSQIELGLWMAESFYCGPGEAMFKMFPDPVKGTLRKKKKDSKALEYSGGHESLLLGGESVSEPDGPVNAAYRTDHTLNADQQSAFDSILGAGPGSRHLVQGITGSGKTELYIHLIREMLARGQNCILLVPEIALTVQMVDRLRRVFGSQIALLHSALTARERWSAYDSLLKGERRIAVGTRSAVFAPIRPGLVILDEEHDGSYKEHSSPRYDARSIAGYYCKKFGAIAVHGSATPRLESRQFANIHYLKARASGAELSRVEIVQSTESDLTGVLFEALKQNFSNRQKSILLLNRRGYFPYLYCKSCRETQKCPRCSVTLPLHKSGKLVCHYCGYARADNGKCSACGSVLKKLGMGTERMEEILLGLFPGAVVERLDTDTARGPAVQDCISRFLAGQIDILLGTQMIAKGLDSPDVTLVGVLRADSGLALPDFRAAERTFALLTQVAGRSGRVKTGRVVFEAMDPENQILRLAAEQNYEAFYKQELEERRLSFYPPFSRILRLLVRAKDEQIARDDADRLFSLLAGEPSLRTTGIELLGPAPAPLERLNEYYRHHMIFKAEDIDALGPAVRRIARAFKATQKKSYLEIDPDPVDLL